MQNQAPYRKASIRGRLCLLIGSISAIPLLAAPLSTSEVIVRLQGTHLIQTASPQPFIRQIEAFSHPDHTYSLYVAHLLPAGFIIANSDDRLRTYISYSLEADAFLEPLMPDGQPNALYEMLVSYIAKAETELSGPVTQGAMIANAELIAYGPTDIDIGPLMTTSWSQWRHYNYLCPETPNALNGYDGRAPSGCVATAIAQVLNYNQWPYRGQGGYSYTDSTGSLTGDHSVTLSDPYDWANMQNAYSYNKSEPAEAVAAVSELMYEVGVLSEMMYEADGSGAYTSSASARVANYLYYENTVSASGSLPSVTDPVIADIMAGFPSVVTVPGHAIVADGYRSNLDGEMLHINYGWGGQNNSWWTADNVAGDALNTSVTNWRPKLIPFAVSDTLTGTLNVPMEIPWYVPWSRLDEVTGIELFEESTLTGNLSYPGDSFDEWTYSGWILDGNGNPGSCYYLYQYGAASMVLDLTLEPDADSTLTFDVKCRIVDGIFGVDISTNGGETYSRLYSRTSTYDNAFQPVSVDLSAYSGQTCTLRFVHDWPWGSYYPGGGVWLDNIEITNCAYPALTSLGTFAAPVQVEGSAPLVASSSLSFSGSSEMIIRARLQTADGAQPLSEAVTLALSDGDQIPDDWEISYGLDPLLNDSDDDLDGDGQSNYDEYVAGTLPNSASSRFTQAYAQDGSLSFNAPEGRAYSIERSEDLSPGSWITVASGTVGPSGTVTHACPIPDGCARAFYRVQLSE